MADGESFFENFGMRLKDKVAIVTGGGAGIGQATAELFAEEGAKVVIAEMDPRSGEATARAVVEKGGSAHFVHADISKEPDCRKISEEAIRVFGRLDILVNNAAVGVREPFDQVTEARFDENMAVNVRGPFFAIQAAVPHMKEGGRIINVSSSGTRITQANAQLAVYLAGSGLMRYP